MDSWGSLGAARIFEGPHATVRLAELGLTEEDFILTVQAGEMERRSCSPLEPSIAPGFKAWAAAFRTLAEQLRQRGWVKEETRGLPRLLHPENAVAIAVINGDEATGCSTGPDPKSKTPRGVQSVLFVQSNDIQLHLPFEGPESEQPPVEHEQITWWLLIHSSEEDDGLRAELSLPIGLGEDGRFCTWEERIIIHIPDLTFSPNRDDEEPPFEVEVNVRPRR